MSTSQFVRELRLMGLTDGAGNLISSTAGALNVYITGGSSITVGTPDKSTFTYGSSNELAIGGVYQDTAPTLTAGTTGAVRLTQYRAFHTNLRDASGNQLLGSALSAASIPVVIASDQGIFTVTANIGTTGGLALDTSVNGLLGLLLAQASNTSGQTGPLILGACTTAAPTYTTAKSYPLSLTTGGLLRVDGSGSTQPISGTVTANIGTSGALALDATVVALQVAQASTTSGQKGGLILGAVTTAAPSYTTAQSSPLSLTTAGSLRVDASGSTITVNPALSSTGTFNTAAISGASTVNAPSNTSGCIIQALDTNTANLRYCFGAVSSSSNGAQLQPGRDSGFIPINANVSICPESGTQTYTVQWVSR